jgi:hypothetical protein
MLTMTRFGYLFVTIILLSWVASFFLQYVPHFSEYSLFIDLGCTLTAIVFALSALIRRKWNAFATFSLLLTVLVVGDSVSFAYRLNNICSPGDRIIRSEADAIKQAQIRIIRARYGSHGIPGYVDEKPGYADFSQTDCCTATRTRTAFGVIVWEVSLRGETIGEPKKRYVSAQMSLSNCGTVFVDESFITAEPKQVDSIWLKIK